VAVATFLAAVEITPVKVSGLGFSAAMVAGRAPSGPLAMPAALTALLPEA